MKKCIFILSFLFPALLLAQGNETATRNWSLKTDLLNPVFESASLEVERRTGEKVTLAGRFGLTWGKPVYPEFQGKLWGFYAKAGPKFYLSDEKAGGLAGFAVQPQLMYSRYHDWDANLYGNRGAYWESSVGLIVQGSYVFALGRTFRFEPMLGVGYAPTFYSALWGSDPGEEPESNYQIWRKEFWDYVR